MTELDTRIEEFLAAAEVLAEDIAASQPDRRHPLWRLCANLEWTVLQYRRALARKQKMGRQA